MPQETLAALSPKDGGVYLDATFGAGGHTRSILQAAHCHVFALDRDPNVQQFVEQLETEFSDRFTFISGRFSDMHALLKAQNITQLDGILMDIGVSSMQLDQSERGFSFSKEAPLDMRMDNATGHTAAHYINSMDEEELAQTLKELGGERQGKRIARAIIEARNASEITTTKQLTEIVHQVIPRRHMHKIDPATRTFQAIRMLVNEELYELEQALEQASNLLAPEGNLVVITFHSGEDIIVKKQFRELSGYQVGVSRHMPEIANDITSNFIQKRRKATTATDEETKHNPRSRSAKLRVLTKKEALC